MKINYETLPEEMKFNAEETKVIIQFIKGIVSSKKYFTTKERTLLLDVIASIEKYIADTKKIETVRECCNLLNTLDDVYSKLKENKTLNLDLTKYKKYYDKYIEHSVFVWSIGEISDMTKETKTPSVEEFGEYVKNHLLPMLALQLIGAIATMLEQRICCKAS